MPRLRQKPNNHSPDSFELSPLNTHQTISFDLATTRKNKEISHSDPRRKIQKPPRDVMSGKQRSMSALQFLRGYESQMGMTLGRNSLKQKFILGYEPKIKFQQNIRLKQKFNETITKLKRKDSVANNFSSSPPLNVSVRPLQTFVVLAKGQENKKLEHEYQKLSSSTKSKSYMTDDKTYSLPQFQNLRSTFIRPKEEEESSHISILKKTIFTSSPHSRRAKRPIQPLALEINKATFASKSTLTPREKRKLLTNDSSLKRLKQFVMNIQLKAAAAAATKKISHQQFRPHSRSRAIRLKTPANIEGWEISQQLQDSLL